MHGSFLKLVPYASAGADSHAAAADADRILSFPSATTGAVLAHLAAWAYLPRAQGGMRNAQHREACTEVLAAVLNSIASEGFAFDLYLDDSVHHEWPAKASGERLVRINVTGVGDLEADGVAMAMEDLPPYERGEWSQVLPEAGAHDTLQDFVQRCSRLKGGRTSAWRQVFWALGDAFDHQLLLAADGELGGDGLKVHIADWGAENSHQLDYLIVSYVAGAREAYQSRCASAWPPTRAGCRATAS